MGECAYYLKAAFPTEAIAIKVEKKLNAFFKESMDAYTFWQASRDSEAEDSFWKVYSKKFPRMMKYLTASNIGQRGNPDWKGLSGHADFGQDDYVVLRQGNVLCWEASSVWHFANWQPLADFIKSEYSATKVVWATEEGGCSSLEALQLYNWKQIVQDILDHKELYPTLIGINDELNILLEPLMKGKRT